MKPISIVGGGLAGLSLAGALRRCNVDVTVNEAHAYPRNRVCGEFICGLRPEIIERLELAPSLRDARRHRTIAWFRSGSLLRRDTLPGPALGISRRSLDQRLAARFEAAGGTLHTRKRIPRSATAEGIVWANGRDATPSRWIGLKMHLQPMDTASDLEFHLGDRAYVGLCAVENGEINLCGLFEKRPNAKGTGCALMLAYLRASGLEHLAERSRVNALPGSFAAVAALGFGGQCSADRLAIGDAHAMIPPFTGDGMAMAFESAAEALAPLLDYAREHADWATTMRTVRGALRARFRRRLVFARGLQAIMLHRKGQRLLQAASASGLLPFRLFFRLLH